MLEHATCDLRKDVLWGYFTALNQTQSWPLERYATQYSIQELLENLESFDYTDPHPRGTCIDYCCGQNFNKVVRKAIDVTGSLFEVLCLREKKSRAFDNDWTNSV